MSLLTVRQVAEQLSISETMTYRLLDRGDIPKIKIGGAVRIDPDDLRAYLNAQRTPKTEPQQPASVQPGRAERRRERIHTSARAAERAQLLAIRVI